MCSCHYAASLVHYRWPTYKLEQNKWTRQLSAERLLLRGNDSHIWVYIGRRGCPQSAHMSHTQCVPQIVWASRHIRRIILVTSHCVLRGTLDTAKPAEQKWRSHSSRKLKMRIRCVIMEDANTCSQLSPLDIWPNGCCEILNLATSLPSC